MGSLIGSTFRDTLAAQFNGVDEYAYVDDPTFKTDTQGAFAFWYRPTTVLAATGIKSMIGFGERNAANNSLWHIIQRYNGSGTIGAPYRNQPIPEIGCRTPNGGAFNPVYGEYIISAGTLSHWVFQSNGTTWTIYRNGSALATAASFGGANNGNWLGDTSGTNMRLTFGCRFFSNAPDSYGDSKINECIYVNRPLTTTEITALYNAGTPRNPHRVTSLGSDLKSWWRFGDSRDDATTVYDEIGSNNLTLVNMDASNYVTP